MSVNTQSCEADRPARGRPTADNPATAFVSLRVSRSEWADLRQIAALNQQRLSVFLRAAINQAVLDCRDDPVFYERGRR